MALPVDLEKPPPGPRSLTSLNLVGNPIAEPLTYPGAIPAESGLLIRQTYFAMEATPGRRLPQYRVRAYGTPVSGNPTEAESINLDYMLLRYNATQSDLRVPVLAVGSNAAPGQILAKFGPYFSPLILPMTLAREVHGLVPGVSAHVSRPGYLPATLVRQADEVSQLFVLWPTVEQLRVLDATEPNYHRVLLDGADWPIILESGEHLSHCYVYLSRHGHLVDSAGRALQLPDHRPRPSMKPGVDSARPANGLESHPAFFPDQSSLISWLMGGGIGISGAAGETAEDFVRLARSNDLLREKIRTALIDRGLVGHDSVLEGLAQGVPFKGAQPLRYEEILPLQPRRPGTYRSTKSSSQIRRRGEAVVRLRREDAHSLSVKHVLVSAANGDTENSIVALARLHICDDIEATGTAEVDQVLRNAVGVEAGEDVVLRPAHVRRMRWPDWLLGRPTYVTCRVQRADSVTIEQEACLIDELTMGVLGISPGDEVVLEGNCGPDGVVCQVGLRALSMSAEVHTRREQLHGGSLSSRFPSSLDALGVYPDLPWIFVDRATRNILELNATQLATVRVRASRRYQLTKDVRELLLVLGVAFIGLATIFQDNPAILVTVLGLLSVLAATVVAVRMRARLTHRLHQPRRQRHHRQSAAQIGIDIPKQSARRTPSTPDRPAVPS